MRSQIIERSPCIPRALSMAPFGRCELGLGLAERWSYHRSTGVYSFKPGFRGESLEELHCAGGLH